MNEKVTVVIPTYNRADFVVDAVNSVLSQSYKNFILIVIDDGSTDDTFKKLISYIDNGFIKYYRQANKGISSARNYGINLCKTKYIAFLDSDDLWKKNKLEKQINALKKEQNYRLCYTDEIWYRNGKHLNQKKHHKKYTGFIYQYALNLCLISPSSVLLESSLFNEVGFFDEDLPACEDYDMWLRITYHYPVLYIDEKLIIKRGGHSNQLSTSFIAIDKFRVEALLKMLKNDKMTNKQKKLTTLKLKEKCKILYNGFLKHNKPKMAEKYLKIFEKYKI